MESPGPGLAGVDTPSTSKPPDPIPRIHFDRPLVPRVRQAKIAGFNRPQSWRAWDGKLKWCFPADTVCDKPPNL